MEIRAFKPSDAEAIIELESRFPPKARKRLTKERMLELYKKNSKLCLVAVEKEKVIGAIFCEAQGEKLKIDSVVIDLDYLGEGVVKNLIERAITESGAKRIVKSF